jgi:hypothetical protein
MEKKMERSVKTIFVLLGLLPWVLGASGCPNAFSEMADKDSDAALFYQAQMEIDIPNYTLALATLAKATAKGLATRSGRLVTASAYAGRCGLNLVDLASKIANGGSNTLYTTLLASYKTVETASTAPDDCYSAEQNIVAIPASSAQKDDYIFLAFNSLAKIGTILAKVADTDDDGVVDVGFNACTTISDDDVNQIGTGLTLTMLGLTNSGFSMNGSNAFTDVCSRLAALPGAATICSKTTIGSFSANERLALRAMIKSTEIGFGTCNGTTGSSAACLCP